MISSTMAAFVMIVFILVNTIEMIFRLLFGTINVIIFCGRNVYEAIGTIKRAIK